MQYYYFYAHGKGKPSHMLYVPKTIHSALTLWYLELNLTYYLSNDVVFSFSVDLPLIILVYYLPPSAKVAMVIRVFIYWVLLPVFQCFALFSVFCLTPWFSMQKLQPLFCLRGLLWCNLAVLCWLSATGGCYWAEDGSGISPGLRTGITSTHSSVLCLILLLILLIFYVSFTFIISSPHLSPLPSLSVYCLICPPTSFFL